MANLVPFGDEQAKAIQEALKALRGVGAFLEKALGGVLEDLVGLLGGDWLRVRRAENIANMATRAQERLEARGKDPEPANLKVALLILQAAADESREQLQDIWARLLAAAMDPSRANRVRVAFIEAVKRMEPLDAAVLPYVHQHGGRVDGGVSNNLAAELRATRDEIDVSVGNLVKLELLGPTQHPNAAITAFGREFLRAISDT